MCLRHHDFTFPQLGISGVNDPAGTRVGVVTFNDDYHVHLYPSDRNFNTVDDVMKLLRTVQNGTGTCNSTKY